MHSGTVNYVKSIVSSQIEDSKKTKVLSTECSGRIFNDAKNELKAFFDPQAHYDG